MRLGLVKSLIVFVGTGAAVAAGVLAWLAFFGDSSPAAQNDGDGRVEVGLPAGSPTSTLDPDIYRVPGNPFPRGLSLIFFWDGYLSWNEFESDIELLMRKTRQVEPWKSYSRYNIYKVLAKELDVCSVVTENERKPTLRCAPEKLNAYLNRIKVPWHFKVIVLSRRDFQSWANVARLQDSGIFFSMPRSQENPADQETTGWMFLHMFGHAFGLKDEEKFVIAKAHSAAHEPDGPNCAPDKATAEKWWGDLVGQDPSVGYFSGCAASKEYIKPAKGSLMNLGDLSTFVPDYEPVSERYLRKILKYCFSEKIYSAEDDPKFFEQYPEFRECT